MRTSLILLSAALLAASSATAEPPRRGRTRAAAQQARAMRESPLEPYQDRLAQNPRDVELEYRIQAFLGRIPDLDLSGVEIHAVRGAVTVAGTVPSAAMHDRILVATNIQDGVRVLRDELAVSPARAVGGGPVNDGQIAERAQQALASDPGVVGPALGVTSRNGVVTVTGNVATYRDAHRIVQAVRNVPGVRNVQPAFQVNESVVVVVNAGRARR